MARTTGTKAERDSVRLMLDGYGVGRQAVAAELQRRFGLRPREAFRQAHGWTQEQVAVRLNDVSGGNAFTGPRVSDYERWPFGGRRPTLTVLSNLAQVFGADATYLVDLEDLAAMPEGDRGALARQSTRFMAVTSATTDSEPAPPAVRALAQDLTSNRAGALDETDLVIAVTERTQAFGAWSESSNVGPVTLEDIAASTRRLAREYLTQAPVTVYGRTGLLADRVFRLLQGGHQQPDQAKELYRWAGYLCALLAWMAGDLGHQAAAESQARTAWTCAELAGDKTLRAWVLSTMSKIYLWDQRYEDAAAVAARGFREGPHGSAAVMLACQEADAWAEIGARDEAEQALDKARDARQTAGVDHIGGLLTCGLVREYNYAGSVLLRIGHAGEAIGRADAALAEASKDINAAYGTTAQIRIWAAAAHLAANSLEGAKATLEPVLALPPERRLDTLVRRLREVGHLITADTKLRGNAQAKDLRTAIADFCASNARQLSA